MMKEKIILNNIKYKGLRSSGLFGKKPIIGLIMFLFGSIIFISLAYNLINHGSLIKWDLSLAKFFHSLALKSSPLVINIMIAGYYIGWWGIFLIAIIFSIYFIYKKFWCELLTVVISLGFSGLIFLFLSNIFKRPRPFLLFKEVIWSGSPVIPGFPSGHTLSTIVCLGFLLYFLLPRIKSNTYKFLLIFVAFLIAFYIGFSRLYIGDHYLTDVIAGYAVCIAWFGLSFTSVELLFKKYYNKKENSSDIR